MRVNNGDAIRIILSLFMGLSIQGTLGLLWYIRQRVFQPLSKFPPICLLTYSALNIVLDFKLIILASFSLVSLCRRLTYTLRILSTIFFVGIISFLIRAYVLKSNSSVVSKLVEDSVAIRWTPWLSLMVGYLIFLLCELISFRWSWVLLVYTCRRNVLYTRAIQVYIAFPVTVLGNLTRLQDTVDGGMFNPRKYIRCLCFLLFSYSNSGTSTLPCMLWQNLIVLRIL